MRKHKYGLGALILIIMAPIFITMIQAFSGIMKVDQLWSLRRLAVFGRTLFYGGTVSTITTFLGWWIGFGIALRHRRSKFISLILLCLMGIPPFMYAFFAMDFARVLLGQAFISGLFVSIIVSVIYWLPLSISLWILYAVAIPKAMYDEPQLSIRRHKAISRVTFHLMATPAKIIGLLILLLAINDYTIPSIFAYNTYPIEIMTIFSSQMDITSPIVASLPMVVLFIILLMLIFRYWYQMDLDLSQNKHPFLRRDGHKTRVSGLMIVITCIYFLIPMGLLINSMVGQLDAFYLSQSFISDMIFAYGSSIIAGILSVMCAYYLSYLYIRYHDSRKTIGLLLVLLLCLPGTLLGLMVNGYYQWIDQILPLSLYKTQVPMVHMLVLRFLSIAFMIIWFGMSQLESGHLDLALMNTKSIRKIVFIVLWPLMKPFLASAFLVTMMFSLGELSGSIMVVPPGKSTLAVTIYNYLHYGSSDVVAMLVTLIFVSIMLLITIISVLIRQKVKTRSL